MTGKDFVAAHNEILKVYGHDDAESNARLAELFERFVDARIQLALSAGRTRRRGVVNERKVT